MTLTWPFHIEHAPSERDLVTLWRDRKEDPRSILYYADSAPQTESQFLSMVTDPTQCLHAMVKDAQGKVIGAMWLHDLMTEQGIATDGWHGTYIIQAYRHQTIPRLVWDLTRPWFMSQGICHIHGACRHDNVPGIKVALYDLGMRFVDIVPAFATFLGVPMPCQVFTYHRDDMKRCREAVSYRLKNSAH